MSYNYSQQQTWTWNGRLFTIYSVDTTWNPVSGLYIFAGPGLLGWKACYIGQTVSFAERIPGHERWMEAQRLGATHIHACVVQDQWQRDLIERELIGRFQPPLNDQLR